MHPGSVLRVFVFVFVFLAAGSALAQGVEILPGQTVTATLEAGDVDLYRFDADSGDAVSLKFKTGKAGNLDPEIRYFQHDATEVALPPVAGGKLSANLVLTRGGTQYLAIRGLDGTAGDYVLGLKLKSAQPEPRSISVPGVLGVRVPQGALLSGKIKAAKGTDLEPGIGSIMDEYGNDLLDPAHVAEKGASISIKGHGFPAPGELMVNLVARAGGPGDVDVKLKVKAAKPALKKLGPADLVETFCARVRTDEGESFLASVEGEGIDAVTLFRDLAPGGTLLPEIDPGEWELAGDIGDYPAGLYTLRIAFDDGSVREVHTAISGYIPPLPVITDAGTGSTPTITWTGIAGGVDFLHLAVMDPLSDEDLYQAILPAGATSHTLPAGVAGGGWPYVVELSAFHVSNSMAVAAAESAGEEVAFLGAVSIGDLLLYTLDTGSLEYTYEILEPVPDSGSGTLVHEPGWGGYVFRGGGDPDDPYVVVLPGSLILGGTEDGNLFAALPEPSAGYDIDDFTGVYNFLQFSCAPGGDCEADYGTFRINADSTFDVWLRSDAEGAPVLTGAVTDSGDGYYVATVNVPFVGPVHFANVMVHEGAAGRLLVIDLVEQSGIFDGGIVLGVEQQALTPGAYDGVYNFLGSDEEGLLQVEIDGSDLDDGEELIRLRFNWPWTGFVGAGNPGTEGGVGLLSPDGIFYLGVWFEDTPGDYVSEIGAAIRR